MSAYCIGCGYRNCHRYSGCPSVSNVGQVGIDSSGDLTVGIGNGLSIDLDNGDLVIDIPGTNFGIDTGW